MRVLSHFSVPNYAAISQTVNRGIAILTNVAAALTQGVPLATDQRLLKPLSPSISSEIIWSITKS